MVYIRISERDDAKGFLVLAKSGSPITCLVDNVYGVGPEQLKLLKRRKIRYKTLPANND